MAGHRKSFVLRQGLRVGLVVVGVVALFFLVGPSFVGLGDGQGFSTYEVTLGVWQYAHRVRTTELELWTGGMDLAFDGPGWLHWGRTAVAGRTSDGGRVLRHVDRSVNPRGVMWTVTSLAMVAALFLKAWRALRYRPPPGACA